MEITERMDDGRVTVRVNHQPSGGREWVAEIVGTHPKFRFEREFVGGVTSSSYSGKTGWTYYDVSPGLTYEVNEPWKDRFFFRIDEEGDIERLSRSKVLEILDTVAEGLSQ